jgi:hypothetical protein
MQPTQPPGWSQPPKPPGSRKGLVIIGLAAAGFLALTTLPAVLGNSDTGTTAAPTTTETTEAPIVAQPNDVEPTTTKVDGSTVLVPRQS